LYIDQPVGTGFSFTNDPNRYPTTEAQVAADLYTALQLFFDKYSEYSKLDFYVTGESYAGK
jgi:vitellogenic carboxypeptidase-like protein